MKIQSHNISTQSEHTYSRSSLQSQMSFSTFLIPQDELMQDMVVQVPKEEAPKELTNFNSSNNMLQSIIQNLMLMLSNKFNNDEQEIREPIQKTRISFYEKFEESESLDYSTLGHIKTDTGTFDINLNFSMSRSFAIENRMDITTSFDPLVINFDGSMPDLSTDTFSFDLDNDGEEDQISQLTSGNGFLALDKNGDGKINQGSELFGTISGDGFGELAQYDEDANSWIDESDSIFNKLRIWLNNDVTQEKELVGLGEVGIGAIYLNATASEFTYKTQSNQTLGELKSCSFFLREDGTCGNISQIDLATKKETFAELLQA